MSYGGDEHTYDYQGREATNREPEAECKRCGDVGPVDEHGYCALHEMSEDEPEDYDDHDQECDRLRDDGPREMDDAAQ